MGDREYVIPEALLLEILNYLGTKPEVALFMKIQTEIKKNKLDDPGEKCQE